MTEDPIRAGQNWYMYCDGNPVMFIDPNGRDKYANWVLDIGKFDILNEENCTKALDAYLNGSVFYNEQFTDSLYNKAIKWWAENGNQKDIMKFDKNKLADYLGTDYYNFDKFDFERFDTLFLGITNYYNAKFGTSIDANDLKIIAMQESKIGYFNDPNDIEKNGNIDIMQVLDKRNYAIQRLAARGNYSPFEGDPKKIPKTGYGLFQKLYPNGINYDKSIATVEMSIMAGIFWYDHKGGNFAAYNGGGDPTYSAKLQNYKNCMVKK